MGKVVLMIGILKFNLPEEAEEFKAAQNGMTLRCDLQKLDQDLRTKLKYDQVEDPETYKMVAYIRDCINNILND